MRGRDVPPQPEPRLPPTIIALDVAMLEGEPWERQTYVAQNWQQLAALAWRGYTAFGRGVVRLIVNPVSRRVEQSDLAPLQVCEYMPLALADEYGCREQAKAMMREYQPQTEILVAFVDETRTPSNPGGTALMFQFQAGGALQTPPEAYHLLQQV